MTKIVLVDDNDQVIDHKERAEVDYVNDIYRSSALWILNSKGEVLIAKRTLTKDKDPGKWSPSVAGTVDEGEDYDINVYKEAEEEVGLRGYKFEKLDKIRFYEPRHQFMQWYKVVVDQPIEYFTPQEEEVERLQWTAIDGLIKDVNENPDKYVASMGKALEVLRESV